jgi:hypothetical protein
MRSLRRFTALVLTLLLGQVMLAGSGYACGRRHASEGIARTIHAGARAHGTHRGSVADTPTIASSRDGCAGDATDRPCDLPGNGATCTRMTTCGVAAMRADSAAHSELPSLTSGVSDALPSIGLTRTIAPELPPPRA